MSTTLRGQRVRILEGFGYKLFDPQAFKRSDGTHEGNVYEIETGYAYLRLDNGRTAQVGLNALEVIDK
jgi:hypothetical protein